MADIAMARQKLGVVAAQLALDAQEGNAARNAPLRQQRFEQRQIDRTVAVVGVAGIAGPGQCDALARQRLDTGAPFGKMRLVRAQIGDVGGNVPRLGLERQRQAAERTMHVIGGQRLTARMAGGDAFEISQQGFQFGLDFEHDTRAGARVVLEVQPELKTLLADLEGVASCHARGETLPAYDVHCPLGSLPLALKTEPGNIPANIPYLRADEAHLAKWRARIEALPGKRVALAWAGNASHANDRNRSIDLALLEPLLAQGGVSGGVSFLSIQRELRGNDAELLARHGNVSHLGGELSDMADTAAVAALADLTISVDTSVVHLAGALGRPVWVMLPFAPDWRWTLTGEHSPWYQKARLLRQPTLGDWPSVIAALRAELARFVTA